MARDRAQGRRRLAAASAALVTTLLVPAPAAAHVRSAAVASDYSATVVSPSPAVAARVYASDLALGLAARDGHTVVVLGYEDEPFLRFGSSGVEVDAGSSTAVETGLVDRPGVGWETVSGDPAIVWHDSRVRAPVAGVEPWAIPLVVDGERILLEGEVRRVPRPPAWPWLLVAGVVVAAATVVARRTGLSRAAVASGATAGLATVALALAFAARSSASPALWVESANELVLAVVGLAVLARGSGEARAAACALLGLLALFAGLLKVEVFTKGVVLAALPDTPARTLVAAALAAGAAALVVGALAFHAAHRQAPGGPIMPEA